MSNEIEIRFAAAIAHIGRDSDRPRIWWSESRSEIWINQAKSPEESYRYVVNTEDNSGGLPDDVVELITGQGRFDAR